MLDFFKHKKSKNQSHLEKKQFTYKFKKEDYDLTIISELELDEEYVKRIRKIVSKSLKDPRPRREFSICIKIMKQFYFDNVYDVKIKTQPNWKHIVLFILTR